MRLLIFMTACALGCPLDLCPGAEPVVLPPAADKQVQFSRDIQPILEASCVNCHGNGRARGGLRLDTRETLLAGGNSGPAVQVGKSGESLLVNLIAGVDPDNIMPQKGKRLSAEQVGLVRAWIDQGLPWDERVSFAQKPHRNLERRKPDLVVKEGENLVDAALRPYFQRTDFKVPNVVEDRVFARRVYLDVVGLLPTIGELDEFINDPSPGKRHDLVRRLLADDGGYAENWLSFWNDLLRNDYRGTGYIDGGRKQITPWLYSALRTNMSYDKFVAALINPSPETEGFTKGIVWRGVVNSSQTPEMQAAQNISQVFMGVNLKCASCHDSFVNDWRLSDAYGLAAIYSDKPLEMFRCDKPTGEMAGPAFIYPQLGAIDPEADRSARLARLAEIMTGPSDGRLPRTIVNRLWARFFGYGLVEPIDDMEQASWNGDLLDVLAERFVEDGYDIKKSIELMLTSTAYQLPAVDLRTAEASGYVFKGPVFRRMNAEQFRDAVAQLTDVWHGKSSFGAGTNQVRSSRVPADPLAVAMGRPNREQVVTSRSSIATTLEAIELTNGETLAGVISRGAEKICASDTLAEDVAQNLFRAALGRKPSAGEAELVNSFVEDTATAGPVGDLLWSLVMLPEFQIIH